MRLLFTFVSFSKFHGEIGGKVVWSINSTYFTGKKITEPDIATSDEWNEPQTSQTRHSTSFPGSLSFLLDG